MYNTAPLLSVCLITYNQVNYVKQAIDGVLMQETDFAWELIIADDFSTDGTREIVVDYYKKYPNRIRLILQKKNMGPAENWRDLMSAPETKYIAYLEGDDYWTDPLKLQKQVTFLEENPEYVLSFHNIKALVDGKLQEDELIEKRYQNIGNKKKITTMDLLEQGNFIHTCSVVFRNIPLKFPFEFDYSPVGDYFLFLLLSEFGFMRRIDEHMGVYRRGIGSYSSLSSLEMSRKIVQYHLAILSYLSEEDQKRIFLQKTFNVFSNFETLLKSQIAERASFWELFKILINKLIIKIKHPLN